MTVHSPRRRWRVVPRGVAAGYVSAAIAVAVATVVAFALELRLDPTVIAPYLVAVGVAAVLGGFGPAIAATGVSTVLCYRWFLGPLLLLDLDGTTLWRLTVYRLAIFVAGALALTAVAGLRRRSEEELRRGHRQLLRFLGDRSVGLCEVGVDGRIAWADDGACALLARSFDDLGGKPLTDVIADAALAGAILACRNEDQLIENRPARARCGDGSERDVLVNANGAWSLADGIHERMLFALVPVGRSPTQLPTIGRRVA